MIALFIFITSGAYRCFTQTTTVTPTSLTACDCSGSVSFTSPSTAPAVFTVYDHLGAVVTTVNSPNGQFSLGGLCARPYSIVMVQDIIYTTRYVFNVPAGNINPGNAAKLSVCPTSGTINLNNQLTGLMSGGTWQNPQGQTIPNILNLTDSQSGWYTYHVNSAGCEVISGIQLNRIDNPNVGLGTTALVCEDYNPFPLISYVQANPDPGGQWYYASNNQPMDGWFYPATMNSQQFYYTLSNTPGCGPFTVFLDIDELINPSPGTSQSISVCSNSAPFNMNSHLGGAPTPGGQWYSPSNQPVSNIFNPATQPPGAYRYMVIGQTPCHSSESFLTIHFFGSNPSGSNGNVTLCASGSAVNMIDYLGGTPQPGGTWRNSANQVVDGVFNPGNEPAGNYTYYYPNVGCSAAQTVLAVGLQQPANAGNDNSTTVCESAGSFNLASLLSGNANAGGVWTNSSGQVINPVITVNGAQANQQYTYTVTPSICPVDVASFSLNVGTSLPQLEDEAVEVCSTQGSFDLQDYYPTYPQAQFTNSAGTPLSNIFDPLVQGSTVIRVINPSMGGCTGSQAEITVTVEQPSFISQTEALDVCRSTPMFDLNTTGNAVDFQSGHWEYPVGQIISNQVSLNFNGQRVYHFISDQEQICSASTFELTLTGFEQYTAGEDNAVTLCNSASIQSLTTMAGSLGSANGNWFFQSAPVTDMMFDPATDASGVYEYIVPANGPCPAASSDLVVTVQYGINYSAGNDLTECFGAEPGQIGQPGQSGTSYQWNPSTNLSSTTAASPLVNYYNSGTQPVTIVYTVSVNDGVCSMEDQVSVTTLPRPVSDFPHEYRICRGETVSLNVTGSNISCHWAPMILFAGSTSQFQHIEPTESTNVEVEIINEWNCRLTDSTLITVEQLPIVAFVPEAIPGCPPLQVHYEYYPATGESIRWGIPSVGVFNGNQINTVLNQPGIYDLTVTATSPFGCSRTVLFTQMMEVYPLPFADFDIKPDVITTVDPIAQFINESVGAVNYEWDFKGVGTSTEESPELEFPNKDPKTFTVCLTAENEFGCKDSLCQFLPLENIYIFYAPTAITPDNDGINDGFRPLLLGFEENTYTLWIYNRWGEEIFVTQDINEPWMGDSNKGDYYVPDGIYTWRVEVKEKIIANYEVFEGHIVVIR